MTVASAAAKPDIASLAGKWVPVGFTLFASAVFLDSLRFKFTNHPNTQVIFGRLDGWASELGLSGLFAATGLFSQYVIGAIELLAATMLILGVLPRFRHLQAGGALAGFLVMAGAVSFHLFTPLGVDPNNDGGGLFVAACINLAAAFLLLTVFRRREFGVLLGRVLAVAAPLKPAAVRS